MKKHLWNEMNGLYEILIEYFCFFVEVARTCPRWCHTTWLVATKKSSCCDSTWKTVSISPCTRASCWAPQSKSLCISASIYHPNSNIYVARWGSLSKASSLWITCTPASPLTSTSTVYLCTPSQDAWSLSVWSFPIQIRSYSHMVVSHVQCCKVSEEEIRL